MTTRFTTITVETLGPVARLTLARPERANAINQAMSWPMWRVRSPTDVLAWRDLPK